MFRKTFKSAKPLSFQIFPENISVRASHEQSVLSALVEANVAINHSCGGMGTCGTCAVDVIEGFEKLGEKTEQEAEISQSRQWGARERLSCQIHAHNGLILKKLQST